MVIMIILLILCLPLVLMLSLFTATEVVSIVVDVPVNGIDVAVEELVELDLDKGESFEVEYLVSPTEAANKDVTFIFSQLGEQKLATFSVDGNSITPTSYGAARVTVETVDGGYRDSFDVVVYTKMVERISTRAEREMLTVGETTALITEYYPAVVRDEGLFYRVIEGTDVVSVTGAGVVRGIGIGTALIEVTSLDNPEARSLVTVSVGSSGVVDFVYDHADITALESTAVIQSVINPALTLYDYALTLRAPDGTLVPEDVAVATLDTQSGLIFCRFIDEAFVGDIEIEVYISTSGGDASKSCYVHRISEIEIGWADSDSDGRYVVFGSGSDGTRIGLNLRPLGADVSYFVTLYYTPTDGTPDINGTELFISSGVTTELVGGVEYFEAGGYISLELEYSTEGVCLVVRGLCTPSLEDVSAGITVTRIALTVVNGHDGTVTVLDEISVAVY